MSAWVCFTPKALHSKAQGREPCERTLGQTNKETRTPKGFDNR